MVVSPRVAHQRMRWIYRRLWRAWGAQGWWPAESRVEMMVGAVLTQQTGWRNVERAIAQLKGARALTLQRLRQLPRHRLERLLRPVGFFRVKAERLRTFVQWLHEAWGDSPRRLLSRPTSEARAALLAVRGIGPETADSILLYGGGHPVFVVDAYTKRILSRHGLIGDGASYDDVQRVFHAALPRDVRLYNEYHALLVRLGKAYCRTVPWCDACPLFALPRVRGVWPMTNQQKPRRK